MAYRRKPETNIMWHALVISKDNLGQNVVLELKSTSGMRELCPLIAWRFSKALFHRPLLP